MGGMRNRPTTTLNLIHLHHSTVETSIGLLLGLAPNLFAWGRITFYYIIGLIRCDLVLFRLTHKSTRRRWQNWKALYSTTRHTRGAAQPLRIYIVAENKPRKYDNATRYNRRDGGGERKKHILGSSFSSDNNNTNNLLWSGRLPGWLSVHLLGWQAD